MPSKEEMLAMLCEWIQRAHQMSLEDYLAARRTGTLKLTAEDAALEVFASDFDTAQRIPARLGLLASIVYVAPAI